MFGDGLAFLFVGRIIPCQLHRGPVGYAKLRDYPGSTPALEQALGLYCDLGDRHGEAEVLNHHGTLHRTLGDPEQALDHYQRSLELARAVGSPLEQAHALEGAGRCALDRDGTASAVAQLRQALEIYQRIGAAEATQLAADLADMDAE